MKTMATMSGAIICGIVSSGLTWMGIWLLATGLLHRHCQSRTLCHFIPTSQALRAFSLAQQVTQYFVAVALFRHQFWR